MAKSEKLFEMLQYIREFPYLTSRDLARLCDVSVRGVYRYLNTLSRAGIHVHFQEDGYKLPEEGINLLKRLDLEDLEALKNILTIGMGNIKDAELIKQEMRFIEMIDENLPGPRRRSSDEVEITPEWVKPTHYGGTVIIGHSSRPTIINPILTHDSISVTLMNLIFGCLVNFDSMHRPVPELAKEWKVSKDGLEWTFFLRNDVKFHDGYPLTAHDVEFTYRTSMNNDLGADSYMAERYELIDEIAIKGDYIFKAKLKYPFAPFAHRMNMPIIPKHLLEGVDFQKTPFNRSPIGSGPFKFNEWQADDTIVLDANKEYYQKGRPALDRLIFKAYPNRDDALEAIKYGEMDIALDIAASDLLFISRMGGFRIYPALGSSYYSILFNLKDPIFHDIKVRKALDYAIDKEQIIKNQLKGNSEVITGPFSIKSWAYNHDVKPLPYSTETAKELLAQLGWKINKDGWLTKDGKIFEIELIVPNISDSLERVVMGLKAQLSKIGVKIKVVYINDSKITGLKFQAILARSATGIDPDSVCRKWHSSSNYNITSYSNKTVDNLLDQGRHIIESEKRREIYNKIHKMIHDDYPAIFLATGFEFIGSSYRIRNTGFFSTSQFLSTLKDWQIIKAEKVDSAREERREAGVGF